MLRAQTRSQIAVLRCYRKMAKNVKMATSSTSEMANFSHVNKSELKELFQLINVKINDKDFEEKDTLELVPYLLNCLHDQCFLVYKKCQFVMMKNATTAKGQNDGNGISEDQNDTFRNYSRSSIPNNELSFGFNWQTSADTVYTPGQQYYVDTSFSSPDSPNNNRIKLDRCHKHQETPQRSPINQVLNIEYKSYSNERNQSRKPRTRVSHREHEFSTSTNQQTVSKPDTNQKHKTPPQLSSEQDFPPIGTLSSNPKPRKRVNPTSISRKSSTNNSSPNAFGHTSVPIEDSPIFTSAPIHEKEEKNNSYSEERALLRAQREEIKFNGNTSGGWLQTLAASSQVKIELQPEEIVEPDLNAVTSKETIDFLVRVYSALIRNHMVPNISTELYFVCQLLTTKYPKVTADTSNKFLFDTVHKCIYFSVSILEHCPELLSLLSLNALKLVCNLPFLPQFSESLHKTVIKQYENWEPASLIKPASIQNAAFQEETDNRNNFLSDISFSNFRKQRDSFCSLLLDWRSSHFSQSGTKSDQFGRRVFALTGNANLNQDPMNLYHLSRLFVSELITTCCGGEEFNLQGGVDEELLQQIKNSSPEKFRKLKKRLQAPSVIAGPETPSTFPDSQAFFKSFLEISNSSVFQQQVANQLCCKLMELNNLIPDDLDVKIDNESRDKLMALFYTLRVLAKFLGFLHFMPYKCSQPLPIQIIMKQKSSRDQQNPPLNFLELIRKGCTNKCLVIVIPWIVEFLAMMDQVAAYLDSYKIILIKIIAIYRFLIPTIKNEKSVQLLVLCLGWLFESPTFPQAMFFSQCEMDNSLQLTVKGNGLDETDFVDYRMISSCCPNVVAAENMIKNYFTGKAKEVRKIKPMPTEKKWKNVSSMMTIQQNLEESFLHFNSASTKRTIEFVAERVASKTINAIKTKFFPDLRKEVAKTLSEYLAESDDNASHKSSALESSALKLSQLVCDKGPEFTKQQCKDSCNKIMPLLFPDDARPSVIEMATKIAFRMAYDKTTHWIQTYLTLDVLVSELDDELKTLKMAPPQYESPEVYSSLKISSALKTLRNSIMRLYVLDKSDNPEDIIEKVRSTKGQISEYLAKTVDTLLSDWVVALLAFNPESLTSQIVQQIFETLDRTSNLTNIICIRNFEHFSRAPQKILTWTKTEYVIKQLLKQEWISTKDLEDQCFTVLKQDWPKDLLDRLASCLRSLDTDSEGIIDWLAWFCQDQDESLGGL